MKKYLTILILAIGVYACGGGSEENSSDATQTQQAEPQQQEVVAVDGSKVWKQYCIACHGAFGDMGVNGAKDLGISELTLEERIQVITKGRNTMQSYEAILSAEEIEAVAKHTFTFAED